jgi:hypothetical protein
MQPETHTNIYFSLESKKQMAASQCKPMAEQDPGKSVSQILRRRRVVNIMATEYIRGRVSKQITDGSKTVVMDVTGFLCVSLGSSTVQLHDSIGSRHACTCSEADFGNQNGDHA